MNIRIICARATNDDECNEQRCERCSRRVVMSEAGREALAMFPHMNITCTECTRPQQPQHSINS